MATSAQIRQQLVAALQLDLIGPGWDDLARLRELLPQPPSIWYTTGFLVPNTFQEEAGRPPEGDAPSYSDQAGEEPSNDASIRQEEREGDDDTGWTRTPETLGYPICRSASGQRQLRRYDALKASRRLAWPHRWPDPIRDDLLVRRGRSAKAGSMDQTGWEQTGQMGLG